MPDRISSRHEIPHGDCVKIVGVLEQVEQGSTAGRKLALILHGAAGHKDYLFQKRLAHILPIDSFRFDFRGNHETGGPFKQAKLHEDIEDINTVVAYLKHKYGYVVDVIVGHSRGSVVGSHWVCTTEDGKKVSAFVNASGRIRMGGIRIIYERNKEEFDSNDGVYQYKVTVARKPVVGTITLADLDEFAKWDTSIVTRTLPDHIDWLTVHGLADKVVPPYDAILWANALSNRSPGIHSLMMVEDADHNFTQMRDTIAQAIAEWLNSRSKLKTGVWIPTTKGKL